MNVAFLSPFGLTRDGVGIYSRELAGPLSRICRLTHFPLDDKLHDRGHFRRMTEGINRCDVLHVEHAHGLFQLALYPFREAFLDLIRRVTVPRVVVYHEPVERIPLHFPYGGDTLAGVAGRVLRYAATAAARPFAEKLWLPWYNRNIFSIPERIVFHTAYRATMAKGFAPDARVQVIPHPVYEPEPPGTGKKDLALPFPQQSFILTVFGFVDHRKDYVGVLEALGRLPDRFKLIVAGGCHEESETRSDRSPYGRMIAYARERRLLDRIHVTGFCPDPAISAIMRATDLVICPFTQDHSSGSINMGIAYGRPVVAYRTLLTEEMDGNGAGLILVAGREELASTVAACAGDPGLTERSVAMGAAYRKAHGFPMLAEWFAKVYRELLCAA